MLPCSHKRSTNVLPVHNPVLEGSVCSFLWENQNSQSDHKFVLWTFLINLLSQSCTGLVQTPTFFPRIKLRKYKTKLWQDPGLLRHYYSIVGQGLTWTTKEFLPCLGEAFTAEWFPTNGCEERKNPLFSQFVPFAFPSPVDVPGGGICSQQEGPSVLPLLHTGPFKAWWWFQPRFDTKHSNKRFFFL